MDKSSSLPLQEPSITSASVSQQHDQLERRSIKSRLSKQEEIEVIEDPTSQCYGDPVAEVTGSTEPIIKATEPEIKPGTSIKNSEISSSFCAIITTDWAGAGDSPELEEDEDQVQLQTQRSSDSEASCSMQTLNAKMKLVRCQAICDDASPPPDTLLRTSAVGVESADAVRSSVANTSSAGHSLLSVSPTLQGKSHEKQKLVNQGGSSQGSTMSDEGPSPAMSRDSSIDTAYTDSTGTNLEEFIVKTLNKNKNDRAMLMRLENEIVAFINDTSKEKWKFSHMSSYHRMLVHRVAAFFGLDHNIDESGKCVVINRLQSTRIPDFKFRDHIQDDLTPDDEPKKSILQRHRDCSSLEENFGIDRIALDDRKCKSFEERAEEYEEARCRIFQEMTASEGCQADEPAIREDERSKGIEGDHMSKDDVHWNSSTRPWSSTDSSGYSTDNSLRLRFNVTKASSFHGVTVLSRGDSRTSTLSSGSRFSKTDSTSSGISNLGSPIVIPPTIPSSPPPVEDQTPDTKVTSSAGATSDRHGWRAGGDGPSTGSPFLPFTDESGAPLAIWVASSIDQIPPGSIIINPQTGDPYMNHDGTMFRWYPDNHALVAEDKSRSGSEEVLTSARETVTEVPVISASTAVSKCDSTEKTQENLSFLRLRSSHKSVTKTENQSTSRTLSSLTSHASTGMSTSVTSCVQPPHATTIPRSALPSQPQQMFIMVTGSMTTCAAGKAYVSPAYPTFASSAAQSGTSYCSASAQAVRFVSSQGHRFPASVTVPEATGVSSIADGSQLGYVPAAWPPEAFQVVTFPPMAVQSMDTFPQHQPRHVAPPPLPPPPTLVQQYGGGVEGKHDTWNPYQQSFVPTQAVMGPMYYAVEPPTVVGTPQTAVGQSSLQMIVVSSAPHQESGMYTSPLPSISSGMILPMIEPLFPVGAGGRTSMSGLPQYMQYTYQGGSAQPLSQQPSAVTMMPFNSQFSGPPPPSYVPPRLVPVMYPNLPLPRAPRTTTRRSPSPKGMQFPTPASSAGFYSRMPVEVHARLPSQPIESTSDHGHMMLLPRASLTASRPRYASARPTPNIIANRQPVIINTGDSRCPQVPLQRLIRAASLQSNLFQQPR